jgi:tryptophan synthase beta chain
MENRRILLREDEIPTQWYNILADIKMNPPLGPDGKPVTPDALAPVFPMNLIEQEVSTQRWIDIPEAVLGVLRLWRLWKRPWERRLGSIIKTKV